MTIQAEIDEDRPMPKSLRHWAEKHGFYQRKGFGIYRSWRRYGTFMARSTKPRFVDGTRDRVRYIRVLPHIDRMDICDGFYDRWANSLGASVPMPKTEAEFAQALETLMRLSRKRVAETWPDPCEQCGAALPQGECNDCRMDGLVDHG